MNEADGGRRRKATTLVALHGNGGGGERFDGVAEHLDEGVRFQALTLPGFGGVPADPSLLTVSDFGDWLHAALADIERPVVVLGHGIGGSIALDAASRRPEFFDGLILHAPVGAHLDSRLLPRLLSVPLTQRLAQRAFRAKAFRPALVRRYFPNGASRESLERFFDGYRTCEVFGQMFSIITADWFDGVRPIIDLDVTLAWGADDHLLEPGHLAAFRPKAPFAEEALVAGWGHFPMIEDPEAYGGALSELVRDLGRRSWVELGQLGTALPVGAKTGMLDRAAAAGLAVPAGVVVPHEVEAAAVELSGWLGSCPAARFAVRSAFSAEDGEASSLAGWFDSFLDVEAHGVAAAVARVRESARRATDEAGAVSFRTDVLVMEMVDADHAGVCFSEPDTYDDIVNVTAGLADKLVSGDVAGDRVLLPRLELADRGWQRRLQRLVAEVRAEFGDEPWDLEWADDGERCWLVQLRPITRPVARREMLTRGNHAEILPEVPSVFMASIIERSGPGIYEWYRRFDPSLPRTRRLVAVKFGRPLLNQSLLEDTLRNLGLPTSLVADSIGGATHEVRGASGRRMLRKSDVIARMGLDQATAVLRSRANDRRARAQGATPAASFGEAVDQASAAYVNLVLGLTPLSTIAGVLTSVLRRAGVLEELSSRQHTVTSELSDAVRRADRAEVLERFGHRGVYESDLARPRYLDRPDLLGGRQASPVPSTTPRAAPLTLRGRACLPLWWLASAPIAARESYRDAAMVGFANLRRSLVRLAEEAVERGLLRTVDDLWALTADEACRLDDGWRPTEQFWADRAAQVAGHRALDVPWMISASDDPTSWAAPAAGDGTLTGLSLTAGVVTGAAWVLDEPATELPEGFDAATTIAVARSVDAGWIPTFGLVAGIAIEIGGDLSHGSILLREEGLPAITNVAGLRAAVRTGDRVTLHASAGRLELEPTATG
ncbi:MAG: alpha/beta fold hydrolase [Acidimicrobiales bacterium]